MLTESYAAPVAEYSKVLKLLDENDNKNNPDVYSQLVEKENNAIAVVNRVVDHEQGKQEASKMFYNMSLLSIVAVFANTWKNIFLELAVIRDFKDVMSVWDVFTKKGRKIYVGLMLGFTAFFIYLVDIAG